LLVLRWKDLNLETGSQSVAHTLQKIDGQFVFAEPTSKSSPRQVTLGETERTALREHRKRQLEEQVVPWQRLVFCTERGGAIDGKGLLKSFNRQLKSAGLPRVRFHDLRNTAAVLMLAKGIHRRSSRSSWGISRSLSRWTSTATSRQRCRLRRLAPLMRCGRAFVAVKRGCRRPYDRPSNIDTPNVYRTLWGVAKW
jgi:integrase